MTEERELLREILTETKAAAARDVERDVEQRRQATLALAQGEFARAKQAATARPQVTELAIYAQAKRRLHEAERDYRRATAPVAETSVEARCKELEVRIHQLQQVENEFQRKASTPEDYGGKLGVRRVKSEELLGYQHAKTERGKLQRELDDLQRPST